MNQSKDWEQFMQTGTVDDYLNFKGLQKNQKQSQHTDAGENQNAGLFNSDGNGNKDNTCG